MFNRIVRLLCLALAALTTFAALPAAAEPVCFDRHKLVRVNLSTAAELRLLLSITEDVWTEHVGVGPLDVRVSPEEFVALEKTGLPFLVLIPDIQPRIEEQLTGPRGAGPFDDYMTNAEVLAHLNSLVALRPDLAQIQVFGTTIQNRTITGLRITSPGGGPKPAVFYHGCIHAREWITVPTALWIADRLVRDYDTDAAVQELVDRVEWYVLPVLNADGYEYTWTNNRLWRKNRRNNGGGSFGVDLNRNWSFGWGQNGGSSSSPSSDTYRGAAPFSEPETQAMRDFFLSHPNIVAYNDIHSYSQFLLLPWGYQNGPPIADDAEFRFVADEMAGLIKSVHAERYRTGTPPELLYIASGVSIDYAYAERGALALSFELRDTGGAGFLLPADQIIPTCEEIFPSIMYQTDYATAPIRIDFPAGQPLVLTPGDSTPLSVRITAGLEEVDPASATLFARPAGGAFTAFPLTHLGGDDYAATLPAGNCGPDLEYYVTANGIGGSPANHPLGAPQAVHAVPHGEIVTSLASDFEIDQGWSVENTAVSFGGWVRVDPNGTMGTGGDLVQPENDNPDGLGTRCYVTGNAPPGTFANTADLDGGPTRLVSPIIDVSGFPEAAVSYSAWLYTNGDDVLTVSLSDNGGASWVDAHVVTHAPDWRRTTLRLADYVTPTDQVRIRFSVSDNPNDSTTDAGVDDVVVSTLVCTPIPSLGDLNCDDAVDAGDAGPLALALTSPADYGAAYPGCDLLRGDMDTDGDTDGDDIALFVTAIIQP